MQKIKDVLRLHLLGGVDSCRQLARAVGCGKSAVADCLRRAKVANLSTWLLVAGLDEAELSRRLYPAVGVTPSRPSARPLPDWTKVREELARADHQMTLALLWEEYKGQHPNGYQYSQFAELYRRFEKRLSVVLRQPHRAGEKCFVDFCDGLALTNPDTGDHIPTQLFVGALGASSFTFARATLSQELPVWLDCHVRMYEAFNGVASITVPDNLRSAIASPDRYEAEINPAYRELAEHYGTCIIPARVRKPRDKAKVEAAVLVAQRWILACLRHRTFYSLQELNEAIQILLEKLNNRRMRHLKKSRLELYLEFERPALKALPERRYEFAEWEKATVNIDYHIEFDEHYYSVHYAHVHAKVMVRATAQVIEIFLKGERIASHRRSYANWKHTTCETHMPEAHRARLKWPPSRLISWGRNLGPSVGILIEKILTSKKHPEQGYRSAMGIIRLEKKYGRSRLEKAARRALEVGVFSYRFVADMLKNNMDKLIASDDKQLPLIPREESNTRGRGYYH